ncbi:hypothetical protein TNCV_2251541, partial [Trichonephila clavipes]
MGRRLNMRIVMMARNSRAVSVRCDHVQKKAESR